MAINTNNNINNDTLHHDNQSMTEEDQNFIDLSNTLDILDVYLNEVEEKHPQEFIIKNDRNTITIDSVNYYQYAATVNAITAALYVDTTLTRNT